jgi:hypothetical protein
MCMSWLYEPDEQPKRKHHWDRPVAGFIRVGQNVVAKCPNNLTIDKAQQILNEAIPWSPRNWRRPYPQRLYNVADGVLYRATPTNPGRSYHGFPEIADRFRPAPPSSGLTS